MKGVQAAVLGGSALVLLILALRLTLKDHLPRRLFPGRSGAPPRFGSCCRSRSRRG